MGSLLSGHWPWPPGLCAFSGCTCPLHRCLGFPRPSPGRPTHPAPHQHTLRPRRVWAWPGGPGRSLSPDDRNVLVSPSCLRAGRVCVPEPGRRGWGGHRYWLVWGGRVAWRRSHGKWHSRCEAARGWGGSAAARGPEPSPSVLSPSAESASDTVPLQRSRSLPHSAAGAPGGTSDPSTLGSSASSDREASRLDKFRQLIAGPHTDLGESRGWRAVRRVSQRPRPGGSAPAPRLPSCGRAAFTCVRRRSVSASCSFSRKAPVTRWASWSCPCPARPGGCPPPSCPWAQGRPATPGTAAFTPAGWGLPLGGRAAGCEPGGGARQASRGRDRTSVVPVGPGTVWAPCRPAGSTCWNPARTHLLSLASAALRRAFVGAGASRPSAVASVTRSLLVGRQVPSGALRAGAPRRAVPLSASRWRVRPTDGRHRVAQAGRTGHRAAGCLGRRRRPWQRGGAPRPAQSSRGLS